MKITESQFNKVLDAYKEADTHIGGVAEMRAELNKLNVEIVPDPKTITINGVEVPGPERVAPENGTEYHVIDLVLGSLCPTWDNDSDDRKYLKLGIVYLNERDCIAATNALRNALKEQP